jgi:hypothetical protein
MADQPLLMMQSAAETPEQYAASLQLPLNTPLGKAMRNVPQQVTVQLPPSAAGAKSRTVPTLQLGTPPAGAPNLLDRLAAREKESDEVSSQIQNKYGDLEKQYQAAQQNSSALKDLLASTSQRIQQMQMGPTKMDLLARASHAMAQPTGLGGMAAAFGNAANAGADVHDQQRAAELQRMQMLYGMGVQGNQAQQQGIQYGIQGAQAGLSGLQTRLNAANAGADRLATAYGSQMNTAAANGAKFDPNLAYLLALNKMQGQMNGAGVGGGGGDPANDPLTKAYASYQVAFPSPPAKASPIQMAQYNEQLKNILAVNPDFQQGNKALADKARSAFNTGANQGQKVEFLNNVLGHMDQYDKLMSALQSGDAPAVNGIIQWFQKQGGHPEVTNVETLQPMLADELVKAMVPNAGTGKERDHQVSLMAASLAPDQWAGKKATYLGALGTQLTDLERQYRSSLHFMPKQMVDEEWNSKLSPEAQQLGQARAATTGAASYNSLQEVQQAVKAGMLPRDQGVLIARQNGWIQ